MMRLVKITLMKKFIKKYNKHEPWFKWLTRELNSYEAFHEFDSGRKPEDVADLVHFLSQDISSYITGQNFNINGGMLMP